MNNSHLFAGSFQITPLMNDYQKALKQPAFLDGLNQIAQKHQVTIKFHKFQTTDKFESAVFSADPKETVIHEPGKTGYEPTLYIDTAGKNKTKEKAADRAILAHLKTILKAELPQKLGTEPINWFDSDIEFKYAPETQTPDYWSAPNKLW